MQGADPGRGSAAIPGAGLLALEELLLSPASCSPCIPPWGEALQEEPSGNQAVWQHIRLVSLLKIKMGANVTTEVTLVYSLHDIFNPCQELAKGCLVPCHIAALSCSSWMGKRLGEQGEACGHSHLTVGLTALQWVRTHARKGCCSSLRDVFVTTACAFLWSTAPAPSRPSPATLTKHFHECSGEAFLQGRAGGSRARRCRGSPSPFLWVMGSEAAARAAGSVL